MNATREMLLSSFDGHNAAGVHSALAAGADACSPIRGKLPVYWLLEEYHRTDRLADCLKLLFDNGAVLDDECLGPVLLNDTESIIESYKHDPSILTHRTSLVSAFVSLVDVTLLHVAAEYGHLNAAKALIELGADVNAQAGVDADGLGGHTPIFHTVNSSFNRSAPIMRLLIDAGADCTIRLDGLYWGRGYEWETVFFDVTPVSFAQMGLMPQVHRHESDIYANIGALLVAGGKAVPELKNIPNKYLQPKHK